MGEHGEVGAEDERAREDGDGEGETGHDDEDA